MRKKITSAALATATVLGAAGAFTGIYSLKDHFEKAAPEAAPAKPGPDERALKIMTDFGAQNNYLILGDTDHSEISLRRFVFRPEFLNSIQAANFKHVALELPQSFQSLIDALAEGKISRRSFVTTYQVTFNGYSQIDYEPYLQSDEDRLTVAKSFADFILEAGRRNIRVLAVDGREGYSESFKQISAKQADRYMKFAELLTSIPEIYENDPRKFLIRYHMLQGRGDAIETENWIDKDLQSQIFIREASDQSRYVFAGRVYQYWVMHHYYDEMEREQELARETPSDHVEFITTRLRQDQFLAQRIKDLTHGEKTIVFYGSRHAVHDFGNLSEQLDNAGVLIMLDHPDDLSGVMPGCLDMAEKNCGLDKRYSMFLFNEGIIAPASALQQRAEPSQTINYPIPIPE